VSRRVRLPAPRPSHRPSAKAITRATRAVKLPTGRARAPPLFLISSQSPCARCSLVFNFFLKLLYSVPGSRGAALRIDRTARTHARTPPLARLMRSQPHSPSLFSFTPPASLRESGRASDDHTPNSPSVDFMSSPQHVTRNFSRLCRVVFSTRGNTRPRTPHVSGFQIEERWRAARRNHPS
jgi:hypothetical protein